MQKEGGKDTTGREPITKIYATYREIQALEKVGRVSSNGRLDALIEKLTRELREELLDYVVARNEGRIRQGEIVISTHGIGGKPERFHSFSKNDLTFILPSPLHSELGIPFVVHATLSDLRRNDFPSSLEVYKAIKPLVKPTNFVVERQGDFVRRTVEEIFAVDAARADAIIEENPNDPARAHLRGLQEYLMIGRLFALTQQERVSGLRIGLSTMGDMIGSTAVWGSTQLPPLIFPRYALRPTESKEALARAGII